MPDDHLKRRLDYLSAASQLLQVSSPRIAASLRVEKSALLDLHKKPTTPITKANTYCTACGNHLIIGWSCTREEPDPKTLKVNRNTSKRQRQQRLEQRQRIKNEQPLRLRCSLCSSITVIPPYVSAAQRAVTTTSKLPNTSSQKKSAKAVGSPRVAHPSATIVPSTTTSTTTTTVTTPTPTTTTAATTAVPSAASRKARSKKSSLAALVASQQRSSASPAAGGGLDLMDFMKN